MELTERGRALARTALALAMVLAAREAARADTRLRIMPPDRAVVAAGQRFDVRVEASADGGAPSGLRVTIDGVDVTAKNVLAPGTGGERGAGGTGTPEPAPTGVRPAQKAAANTTNLLLRDQAVTTVGAHTIEARTADGATTKVTFRVEPWRAAGAARPRAKNIIFFLGDGMGVAHRTAARIVSRGVTQGKADGLLAMDTLEYTGQVMTSSLNAVVTDSAPGMASYSTGNKAENGQEGVFPDNTPDPFDNPRIEYVGAFLKRTRGAGFNVGIVTTADVTDATPAANAVHTANRVAASGIAQRFFDERSINGVSVLMGGGAMHFKEIGPRYEADGYTRVGTRAQLRAMLEKPAPAKILGLFSPSHMPVAFDKVGAGKYSDELARTENAALRDLPMLDEMARLAIASLSAHSPKGFYLLVEGASIDKQAHQADSERSIWDAIEFDHAVETALAFADRTNADADPTNDTLVIVTADHECGAMGVVGVGNERYAPQVLGKAVRDYLAVRFGPTQSLNLFPNYVVGPDGFPVDPDPSRKLLLAWGSSPDRYENWLSNRYARLPAVVQKQPAADGSGREVDTSMANAARDGQGASDNKSVSGTEIPGFLVTGIIENGALSCVEEQRCEDTSSMPQPIAGHSATDVVLGASGPGGLQFTGVYDNTEVLLKMLRASEGSYASRVLSRRGKPAAPPRTVSAR